MPSSSQSAMLSCCTSSFWRKLGCKAFQISPLSLLLSLFIFYFSFTLGAYIYCSYTLSHVSTLCPQLMAVFVALIVCLVVSYVVGTACFCHVYGKRRRVWQKWKELEAEEERLDDQEIERQKRDGTFTVDDAEDEEAANVAQEQREGEPDGEEDELQPGEHKQPPDLAAQLSPAQSDEGIPQSQSSLTQSLLSSDEMDEFSSPTRFLSIPSPRSSSRCSPRRLAYYLAWGLWFLFLIALFAVCTLFFALVIFVEVNTLPELQGVLSLPGLQRPVMVSRDDDGLIHVQGYHRDDVYFAQGVVMAQERLWQMEMQRKVGQGRLSELVGVSQTALDLDRLARVVGFQEAAEAALPALNEDSRKGLDAFIRGINAYLATDPPLSLEFYVLGLGKPEPWQAADVLVWAKLMSWLLSGNMERELQRWDMMQRGVKMPRIDQLLPPYDISRFPTVLPDDSKSKADEAAQLKVEEPIVAWLRNRPHLSPAALSPSASALRDSFNEYRRIFGPTHASNNWVVGGSLTSHGAPLLCNDPHLPLSAPSIWILFHLQVITDTRGQMWRREDVMGASLAGIPGILIGRNNASGWAVTNTGVDVQDLYVMTDSKDGTQYQWKNQWLNYTFHTATIKRKGASDVTFTYRSSQYGPVISDLSQYSSPAPLSLHWTSLLANDTTVNAFLAVNLATDVGAFRRALREYVAPSQNFLFADKRNIAYQMSGIVPLRVPGHTGKYPAPGDGSSDWTGWVPYDALPSAVNPKQDFLVSANNRVTNKAKQQQYVISEDWDEGSDGYRALRIQQLILAQTKTKFTNHSLLTMQQMQADQYSLLFDDFKPLIKSLKLKTEAGKAWQRRLNVFNGVMEVGSEEATVFQLFYGSLCTLVYKEINATLCNPVFLYNVFINGDKEPNCDGYKPGKLGAPPPKGPSDGCVAWASDAFDGVVSGQMSAPGWGSDVKQVKFAHNVLTGSVLGCLSDRRVKHGGDVYTVNVGVWHADAGGGRYYTVSDVPRDLAQSDGSSYRQIIDLGDMERSQWEPNLGQSGNMISPWYDNTLDAWSEVKMLPMKTVGFQRAYVLWLTSDSTDSTDPNDHIGG